MRFSADAGKGVKIAHSAAQAELDKSEILDSLRGGKLSDGGIEHWMHPGAGLDRVLCCYQLDFYVAVRKS